MTAQIRAAELLAAGLAHHQNGRLAEAESHYRRIIDAVPDHADAHHLLGVIACQIGRHQAAIELIGRAIQQNGKVALYFSSYGLALQGLGRLNEAVLSYDRAVALQPDYAEALNNRGNALCALKRFAEALDSYDQGLAVRPDLAELHYNRADALRGLGRLEEAVAGYHQALRLKPDYAEALINCGLALYQLSRFGEALQSCDRALALRPIDATALINRGLALHQLRRFREALESYDRALAGNPDDAAGLVNRGLTLHQLDRFAEAVESYDRALAVRPDRSEALINRGLALHRLERLEEAVDSYERALALRPDHVEALNNRGLAFHDLERFAEAVASYERALALRPAHPEALNNRGLAFQQLGNFAEALASYDRALAINRDYPQCQLNRAQLLLRLGRFAEGWRAYEWRRRTGTWNAELRNGREWDRADPAGKRLLFYSEQGLGDTIQFSRFACSVAESGGEVWVEAPPPLGRLLHTLRGVKVVRRGETTPEYNAHLPLMSLPLALGAGAETGFGRTPYLSAEPARIASWAERLPAGQFRVGIVWQGKPVALIDKGRSIPLRAFAPLARVPGVTLISLQKNDGVEQLALREREIRVHALGADFDAGPDAFLDSAAVMMNLDLVITSDTASAHLAGALGCSVWIVLNNVPEWRWMSDRADTPWYPTARLYRQTVRGDWDEVFARIAADLAIAVAEKKPPGRAPENVPSPLAGTALVPVSLGELVDKITILDIKSERIHDSGKLTNIHRELGLLGAALAAIPGLPVQVGRLKAKLRTINEALWDIEEQLRNKERDQDFGKPFVELARRVYLTNDRRSAVKRRLSQLAGSALIEEKSYPSEWSPE